MPKMNTQTMFWQHTFTNENKQQQHRTHHAPKRARNKVKILISHKTDQTDQTTTETARRCRMKRRQKGRKREEIGNNIDRGVDLKR